MVRDDDRKKPFIWHERVFIITVRMIDASARMTVHLSEQFQTGGGQVHDHLRVCVGRRIKRTICRLGRWGDTGRDEALVSRPSAGPIRHPFMRSAASAAWPKDINRPVEKAGGDPHHRNGT